MGTPPKMRRKMHLGLGARIMAALPAHWLAQTVLLLHILDKSMYSAKQGGSK